MPSRPVIFRPSLQSVRRHPSSPSRARLDARVLPAVAGLAVSLAGCSLPTVNVGTKDPIVIDPVEVRIRVDVYQHQGGDPGAAEQAQDRQSVAERKRNRMAEIQTLKNNRLVGENHLGLLDIRERPAGDYGDYVEKTVEAENEDRLYLMRAEAAERDLRLAEVQREQWQARTREAFAGEWVEVAGDGPNQFRWVQKESNDRVE